MFLMLFTPKHINWTYFKQNKKISNALKTQKKKKNALFIPRNKYYDFYIIQDVWVWGVKKIPRVQNVVNNLKGFFSLLIQKVRGWHYVFNTKKLI